MIHATIFQDKRSAFTGFHIEGHAGYAAEGLPDILCAGVSMLVLNTMNAIEAFTSDRFVQDAEEDTAAIDFQIEGEAGEGSILLLRAMVLGLEMLEDDEKYSDYIDITFEEVSQS